MVRGLIPFVSLCWTLGAGQCSVLGQLYGYSNIYANRVTSTSNRSSGAGPGPAPSPE